MGKWDSKERGKREIFLGKKIEFEVLSKCREREKRE